LAAVAAHPYFQAGDWVAQRLGKLESLLEVYRRLAALAPGAGTVVRREAPSRAEFLEQYYAANRPAVLTGLMRDWKALTAWTPEYLKAVCGQETVQVMAGRDADPRYEINSATHRRTMRFTDYADLVQRGGASNDHYLVANNHFFRRPGTRRLLDDVVAFPEYLDGDALPGGVFFWFGPAGTVTPSHHDTMNILMAQVYGRKRVRLLPSNQIDLVYNEVGVYSEVDWDRPDYARHPRAREATPLELVLEPGEVLFIPVGWWHDVRALDVSMTVSFTNFVFPNSYEWAHPQIRR
jgi:hypothetical protein